MLAVSIFGGFAAYGLACTYCQEFALAAGMSTINPFVQLLWDRCLTGKPLGPMARASLGLACCSVILMLCADMLSSVVGIFWAVVSAVFYVMYVKWSDELNTRMPFLYLMTITFFIGTLLSLIPTFWFEHTTWGPGPESIWGLLEDRYTFMVVFTLGSLFVVGICCLTGSVPRKQKVKSIRQSGWPDA
jgi:drug/metabolite transporter (DMT)-like permease